MTSDDDIALSIIICTHNRSASVAQLLAALVPQMAGRPVELILVDSASTRRHRAALDEIVARYPDAALYLVRLGAKGVSLARNAGLDAAQATWIGYIDDDEVPSPNWVEEALALTLRLPDDCGACGGVVRPDFGPHCDVETFGGIGWRWRSFLGEIAAEGEFDQTEKPKFGVGHSLLRVGALRQAGGFNPALGRDGKSLLSGEEVLLLIQLESLGWRVWHSSRIWVLHNIEPNRLKRRWARSRSYWEGVTTARIRELRGNGNTGPAALAALKMVLLAALAPFASMQREIDLRIAFNSGFVTETARRFVFNRPELTKSCMAVGFWIAG